MTLQEIIDYIRNVTDDNVSPYLRTDKEITSYANQVISEVCRETPIVLDNVSTDCGITLSEGIIDYVLSPRIEQINLVQMASDMSVLSRTDYITYTKYNPAWTTDTYSKPIYYMLDKVSGKITLSPAPSSDYEGSTLKLSIIREPLTVMDESQLSESPEIPTQLHWLLLNGILFYAYQKNDVDSNSVSRVTMYKQLYDKDIENIKWWLIKYMSVNKSAISNGVI